MSEILSFPGLGWEFTLNRVAFTLLERPIYWYGILFALAFLAGLVYAMWRAPHLGLNPDRAFDVILISFMVGMVCARLYYVIFSWETYRHNPISILFIWEGGIGIYGGLIGAFAAGIWYCRKKNIALLPMLDLGAASLLVAQAIGRWGNFTNMEAFGTNTTLPWGMTSPTIRSYLAAVAPRLQELGITVDPNLPVHPTFLYESLWNLLGFALIGFWLVGRRKYDGQMFLSYITWYGAGRFVIEGLRTDSLMLGSFRVSQLVALACVIAGLYLLRKYNKAETPPLYSQTTAPAISAAETPLAEEPQPQPEKEEETHDSADH